MVKQLKTVQGQGGGGGGEVDPDTLFTNTIGKGIYIFSEGPVGGLKTGDSKSIYLNDVPLRDVNGITSAKGVSWTWRDGLPDQKYIDGYPAAVTFQNVGVNVKQGVPYAVTIANGSDNYDAAYVVVAIPTLAFRSAKGNLRKNQVSYTIDVRANGGSWVTQHSVSLDEKASSQWEGTYRVELPPGGSPWQVRLNRTSRDSDVSQAADTSFRQSETQFARYATITDGKFTYRNTAALGIQFDAKEYGDNIPTVKALIKGIKCYVPKNYDPATRTYATTGPGTSNGIWDGSFKVETTSNPLWIYHDLLVNNRYGLGQDFNPNDDPETAFVDKWALYSLAQYADEPLSNGSGGTEPRYSINCQITNKQEAYDLLQNIIASVSGMLYFSAEQIVAVADRPLSISDAFTQADVVDGYFEYQGTALKTRHSVAIVTYQDADNLYKTANVIYEDPDYIAEIGYRVTEVQAFGCTSRAQALRLAKWTLRTERTQTQTVTFKTGHRGGLLKPGEVIKVFDDYKTGERNGGRVLSSYVEEGRTYFVLDQAVSVTSSDKLVYIDQNGELHEYAFAQSFSATATVAVAGTRTLPIDGGTFGIVKASVDGQQYRILMVSEDQEDGKYIVSGLLHDPNKFAYIDEGVVLDPAPTSVLTSDAPSRVTSGSVVQMYEEISGSQSAPKATVSWSKPRFASNYSVVAKRGQIDDRITNYELQFKTPWGNYATVYEGTLTSWTSPVLEVSDFEEVGEELVPATDYGARVRSVDALGRVSPWYNYDDFAVVGKTGTVAPPTNFTITSLISGVSLQWDNPVIPDFRHVEVWGSVVNDIEEAALLSEISDDFYILSDIVDTDTRYFWIRTVTHSPTDNFSAFVAASGSARRIAYDDFEEDLSPVQIVDGLPDPSTWTGSKMIFDSVTQKIYNLRGGMWVAVTAVADSGFEVAIAAPSSVAVSSNLVLDNTGTQRVNLAVSWTAPADAITKLGFYEVEITEGSGTPVTFVTTTTNYTREVLAGTLYTVRVAAVSKTGYKSPFAPSTPITHTSVRDTIAPDAPTWVGVTAGVSAIRLEWVNPSASDLAYVQVFSNTTNTMPAEPMTVLNANPSRNSAYNAVYTGSESGIRYFWLKAVDTSGNVSVATAVQSATIATASRDNVAPSVPTGVTLTTSLSLDNTGNQIAKVRATWTAPTDLDLVGYSVRIKEGASGNYLTTLVGTNSYEWTVKAGTTYYVGVSAFDQSNNYSAYTSDASIVASTDTVAPGTPTGIQVNVALGTAFIFGQAPADADIEYVQLYESSINDINAAYLIARSLAYPSATWSFTRTGLPSGAQVYYWVRSVDTSGNVSAFSASVLASTPKIAVTDFASSISPVELFPNATAAGTPSVGRTYFNTTDYQLYRGNGTAWVASVAAVNVTGQLTSAQIADLAAAKLTGSITSTQISDDAITTPKLVTGAITTAKIAALAITAETIASSAITTEKIAAGAVTANEIAANTITSNQIAANTITAGQIAAGAISTTELSAGAVTTGILGANAVTAEKIAANTITANEIAAGTITGTQISATSVFPATITVSGTTVSLGGLTNPAALINTASTLIEPGKITISGGTTLSDWRQAGDTTKIAGGSISANTIDASKLTIANRALSTVYITFTGKGNTLSWTSGFVNYIGDLGNAAAREIASGSTTYASTPVYVYWVKGSTSFIPTTNVAEAYASDRAIVALWNGGGEVTSFTGRTIIDGSGIQTNSVHADRIMANTITADQIAANTITGDRIQANSINADRIQSTSSLPATLTIGSSGFSLNTIKDYAVDPAAKVNSGSTVISPGKILISGGTTLDSWRNGTSINGGAIATNSISASKLTINSRGISVIGCEFEWTGSVLRWTAGYVLYPDNDGAIQAAPISAGSTSWLGGGFNYIYWPQGSYQLYTGSDNWAALMSGSNLIMCTWSNGSTFVANYGGTIVHGDKITTGSVHANRITAGTISATEIAVGTITADRMNVTNLSAVSANLGDIVAGQLRTANYDCYFDLNNKRMAFAKDGYAFRQGVGIGSGVLMWYGSNSIGVGSESVLNSIWALGTDGKVYYGAVELAKTAAATFNITPSNTAIRKVQLFGSGNVTTDVVSLTPSGHTGTVYYGWSQVFGATDMTVSNLNSSNVTFSANPPLGGAVQTIWAWSATDTGTGLTRSGQVYVTIIREA